MNAARALKQARRRAGLTQRELAARAGLRSADRVRDWERGVHAPRATYVPRLAAALAVEPLALYDVDPSRPPLAVLRRARGLSLQRLAAAAGVPLMTCHRIEQGTARPDTAVLARLSTALGVPAEQMATSARNPHGRDRAQRSSRAALSSAGPVG